MEGEAGRLIVFLLIIQKLGDKTDLTLSIGTRWRVSLEFDIIHKLFLDSRVRPKDSVEHRSLSQAAGGHYASIGAAPVFGTDMNGNILWISDFHDLSGDVVAKFFLQGSTTTAPLGDASVFA